MGELAKRSDVIQSYVAGRYVHDTLREKGGKTIGYVNKDSFDGIATHSRHTADVFDELEEIADVFRDNCSQFAETLCEETSYPIADCIERVRSVATYLGRLEEHYERLQERSPDGFDYNVVADYEKRVTTVAQPIGHVLMVTPRNATFLGPVNIASALVGGNAATIRPSTRTPESAARMLEPFLERFPDRVNLAFTDPDVLYDPDVLSTFDLLHYEGSSKYYPDIKRAAAQAGIASNVEGEGNGVFVVGGRPTEAAAVFTKALTRCNGRMCSTPSGLFVREDVAEEFEDELKRNLETVTAGDPREEGTDVAATVEPDVPEAETFLEAADGSVRLFEFQPGIDKRELFGPGAWYDTWETVAEVEELLADRDHGLTVAIYDEQPERYLQSLNAISARVCLNRDPTINSHFSPWGAMKRSGESPGNTRIEKFQRNVILVEDPNDESVREKI